MYVNVNVGKMKDMYKMSTGNITRVTLCELHVEVLKFLSLRKKLKNNVTFSFFYLIRLFICRISVQKMLYLPKTRIFTE